MQLTVFNGHQQKWEQYLDIKLMVNAKEVIEDRGPRNQCKPQLITPQLITGALQIKSMTWIDMG